jgi:hypothetical protein
MRCCKASTISRRAFAVAGSDTPRNALIALPSATATLRNQRAWPIRRIALPSVCCKNSASVQLNN